MELLLTASDSEYNGGKLEDGSSFGRQLLESDVLDSDDFAVPSDFFECDPFSWGDSSLMLDAWRDFPLLRMLTVGTRITLPDGSALLSTGKYDRAFLVDASVDSHYKVI